MILSLFRNLVKGRICYISTRGFGITALTDAGLDYMLDIIVDEHFHRDAYGKAANAFADLCDQFVTQAKTGAAYDTFNMPKEEFHTGLLMKWLGIGLVIGLLVALAYVALLQSQLKSVRSKAEANNYLKEDSLNITSANELFLYHTVNRSVRQSSSGGGSSTHTSSSGATHGGGGRR